MILSGNTQCPLYFRAAHAACIPLSPQSYASMKWCDQVANLLIIGSGMLSSDLSVLASRSSSHEDGG